MTDFGHDLRFGTFVTPSAQTPRQTVELAIATDRAGLDLVTFQDHPYQASFLDTSTLLAFVAARTERVQLSANVTSLPLRPPVVLAKAAASLDLLTGGRVDLGLGAGTFFDAVAAMGGRHLTAGQAIAALREAIPIIRSVWDVETPGGIRFDGEYYSISGARRGPRPAHDIPIWIGAFKPRMLALVGELGDGWLPSIDYLPSGLASMPEMNAIIDDSAHAAGRAPADVRRLLNFLRVGFGATSRGILDGPPQAWVDQITDMALTHGVSTFIIATDDIATIERFASEVVPEARALVERER